MDRPTQSDAKQVDPRYCRTHAMVAEMFADSSTSRLMRESWRDIARSWEELAGLKERAARERFRFTQQAAALQSELAQASTDKR